ncbi:MAG: DUF2795 domain-containing protein [Patescibacteria group bacterium]|nr:DUF2795 domain-containing protein [Patescibacteria group bacterium]
MDQQKVDEMKKYLEDVSWPARPEDIAKQAENEDAPNDEIQMLKQLPDREYQNPNEVIAEITKRMEEGAAM